MVAHDTVPADRLRTLHTLNDLAKLDRLAADMAERGWQGRPLLVHDDANGLLAWTGTHRVHAARLAGAPVPVVYITADVERTGDECFDDDDRRMVLLEAGDDEGAELMEIELAEANS